jgi:hypothetical protein
MVASGRTCGNVRVVNPPLYSRSGLYWGSSGAAIEAAPP